MVCHLANYLQLNNIKTVRCFLTPYKMILNMPSVKLAIVIAILSGMLVGCKKEDTVAPTTEKTIAPPKDSVKAIAMNATFSTPNMTATVLGDSIEYYQFKAVFTNTEITKDELSDSLFVWELVSATLPASWYVYVCADGVCNSETIKKADFDISSGGKTSFYIDFATEDAKGFSQPLGKGTAEAVYLIYRKGMKKEDGIKVTVKLTAE